MIETNNKIPVLPGLIRIEELKVPAWLNRNVAADVLRLDLIHPVISGNKWFKLQFYLEDAIAKGCKRVVTFGGTWSNHLLATAAACHNLNLSSIGIIRGEEPLAWSSTLREAKGYGMELRFISRENYRVKEIPFPVDFSSDYIIPEGGFGEPGVRGASTICDFFNGKGYTYILCASGTGTMAAGLINGVSDGSRVCVISVLKNDIGCVDRIRTMLTDESASFHFFNEFHFGGYAKFNASLLTFMNAFYSATGVPTDIVYTGKLFYALDQLIQVGFFPAGSKILTVHSGGLQGNSSLPNGTLIW